jgi:hypothetical protein
MNASGSPSQRTDLVNVFLNNPSASTQMGGQVGTFWSLRTRSRLAPCPARRVRSLRPSGSLALAVSTLGAAVSRVRCSTPLEEVGRVDRPVFAIGNRLSKTEGTSVGQHFPY